MLVVNQITDSKVDRGNTHDHCGCDTNRTVGTRCDDTWMTWFVAFTNTSAIVFLGLEIF